MKEPHLIHSSCEMDTKIEIKEEHPLLDDTSSQSQTEFFTKNVAMKINSNDVCDMPIKIETKSESPLPDFQLKEIKIEEQTSQNENELLQEYPATKFEQYNSDHEIDNKLGIKEECCWQETETSSVYEEVKEEDFSPEKSLRLATEAVSDSGETSLCSAEELSKNVGLYIQKGSAVNGLSRNPKGQGSYDTERHSAGTNIHLEPSKYRKDERTYNTTSYMKQKNVIHELKKPYKCELCDTKFTRLPNLKKHKLIHEGKRPHGCEICERRFIQLSDLRKHYLIHAGKRPYKCEICEKRFTQISNLRNHNIIHEGKKPHKCYVCEKRFSRLSSLKRHNLIHEGKQPHICAVCEKRFTEFSDLKKHNLIHDGQKPHKCQVCKKGFIRFSDLKRHNMSHDNKKEHKCSICEEIFPHLSSFKLHNLIHEGKEP